MPAVFTRPFLTLLGLGCAVWLIGCAAQMPEEQALPLAPTKSPNDDKAYRYIELDNGLRALLISDPDTTKSAAALDVYVGSASNPEDRGGLAHFLEHMLFLGTDKYPDSGEYARFVSEHGGTRNAYTSFEHTNYFFDIDDDYLPEALDRFAQFFIAPRFDLEYVSREVNAVHAEFQQGLNTDSRRGGDVSREIANPQHPYHILAVGTKDTLADLDNNAVRDDLIAFYEQYYSANLMRLAVLGSEDLDALESLVRDTFAPVPNRDVVIEDITAPLMEPDQLPLQVYVEPEATSRSLTLSWPMPDINALYRSKPLSYISNLIGHEGEGSLLSLLKSEGWAEALGSGTGISYRGGAAFNISISLTERGVAEKDAVIAAVFEYIHMLEDAGPSERIYREQAQLAALRFRFQESMEPMRYVSRIANNMQVLPPQEVLSGGYLMSDYDPEFIQKLIREYLTPERLLATLTAPGVPVDRESEYYLTPYSTEAIDLAAVGWTQVASNGIDPRLHLPAANAFIAEDVDLRSVPAENPEVPQLVVDEPRLRVWQRQDDVFRVPKGALYTNFRTALVSDTAEHAAASELYVSLLRDAVNEFTYPALLAGLNYNLGINSRGISLSMGGYNDKQQVLLEHVVDNIRNAAFDQERFDNIREDLIRSLRNVKTARAYQQVIRQGRRLLTTGRYAEQDIIAALQALTPETVTTHGEALWRTSTVDVLLYGNYDDTEVLAIQEALDPLLKHDGNATPPESRITRIKLGQRFVYVADVDHSDSVLLWYIQAPGQSLSDRAMAAITGQAVSADYFEDLRTEQQLGYIVNAFNWPLMDVPGVAMMVQSPTASAAELVSASETFLAGRIDDGDAVSEAQFLRHKTALLEEILDPPKNLFDASEYFWREINRGSDAFDTKEVLAEAVRAVTFDQWKAWYQQAVLQQPASLIMVAAGKRESIPDGERVEDPDAFRAQQPAYDRSLARDRALLN